MDTIVVKENRKDNTYNLENIDNKSTVIFNVIKEPDSNNIFRFISANVNDEIVVGKWRFPCHVIQTESNEDNIISSKILAITSTKHIIYKLDIDVKEDEEYNAWTVLVIYAKAISLLAENDNELLQELKVYKNCIIKKINREQDIIGV